MIDLRVAAAGATRFELAWTATVAAGDVAQTAVYEIHASTEPIGNANFGSTEVQAVVSAVRAVGLEERVALNGLTPGRRYWIALRAVDALGLASPLSNVVNSISGPLAGRPDAAIAAGQSPTRAPVGLFWKVAASGAHGPARIRVLDVTGRLRRTLRLPAATEGVASWDGADEAGARVAAGVYFARLDSGSSRAGTRFVLLW